MVPHRTFTVVTTALLLSAVGGTFSIIRPDRPVETGRGVVSDGSAAECRLPDLDRPPKKIH
jgi:hypothetical protein